MPYIKPPAPFFWERLPSYQVKTSKCRNLIRLLHCIRKYLEALFEFLFLPQVRLRKVAPQKHHKQRRLDMLIDHGVVESHLTKIYPECIEVQSPIKKKKEA